MMNRRDLLSTSLLAAGASTFGMSNAQAANVVVQKPPIVPNFCFNTACIRPQKIPLPKVIASIANAKSGEWGYTGIEPWLDEIQAYLESGGTVEDLKKLLEDNSLKLTSLIAFANWGSDDETKRTKGLEEARRTLSLVAQLGGKNIAAPPAGISDSKHRKIELDALAERYGKLLEIGKQEGVDPMLEVWGHSSNLSKLCEVLYVASACGQPAPLLLDVYHLYKGGSDLNGLKLISGNMMPAFHINDLPTSTPREEWNDSIRVYPGDGNADVAGVLQTLYTNGFQGALSLELFNKDYWDRKPDQVIQVGLEKMVASFQAANIK